MMRGADILVKMLLTYEVDTIFGVPGDNSVAFYRALRANEGKICHVMARDERSAGFMADAYGRLTNKPGVFECPAGAGAMYSLPPVAESNASSVPVILLTIDNPMPEEGRVVITELDCVRIFEPVTKMSVQVKTAEKLPEIIRRAFRVACSGTPGAVHLQIPADILIAEVDTDFVSLHGDKDCSSFPAFPMGPAPDKVDHVIALLQKSHKPLLVVGGGVNRSCVGTEVLFLAERLNLPVVNTITGQGNIPDDHWLAIGVIGDNGFHPHANRALEESDLVIFVGSKMGSVVTVAGTFPKKSLNRRVVQIDINPECLANNNENVLSIAGDAKLVLSQIRHSAPILFDMDKYNPWVEYLNSCRDNFWQGAKSLIKQDNHPLRPERVVNIFNEQLDKYGELVNILCDAGTPTPYMTRFLKIKDPSSRFIIPRAFGGLGWAIPAVVGAYFADTDCKPIGMFGDGSLGMSVGELETLVRLKVPAILMLFNNGCFGWTKALHRMQGFDPCYGVDFIAPKGKEIGEAFGLKSWTIRTSEELEEILEEAFQYDGPCLLDIHVESIADRVPPVFSWLDKRGRDPMTLDIDDVLYE